MDINLIRNFVAIVDARSRSEAARRRDITRSKVSKELKALEASMGVTLLHRTTRSMLLADAARSCTPMAAASSRKSSRPKAPSMPCSRW